MVSDPVLRATADDLCDDIGARPELIASLRPVLSREKRYVRLTKAARREAHAYPRGSRPAASDPDVLQQHEEDGGEDGLMAIGRHGKDLEIPGAIQLQTRKPFRQREIRRLRPLSLLGKACRECPHWLTGNHRRVRVHQPPAASTLAGS